MLMQSTGTKFLKSGSMNMDDIIPESERRKIQRDERRKRREQRQQKGGKKRRVMKPSYSDLDGDERLFCESDIHSSDYSSDSESDCGKQSGFGYDNKKKIRKAFSGDGDDEGDGGDDDDDVAEENKTQHYEADNGNT